MNLMIDARTLRLLRGCLVIGILSGACGYSLSGRGAFLPDYIKTVGVPQCVNQTAVFDLDRVLTQNVQRELGSHGRYKAVPESTGVDALLTCIVKTSSSTVASTTGANQASRYVVVITASIEFKDLKADKVLWSNPAMQFREEYDVTNSTNASDPAAFFGQDKTALERLAQNFARSIVTSILEAF
jgi:hypothetical protein